MTNQEKFVQIKKEMHEMVDKLFGEFDSDQESNKESIELYDSWNKGDYTSVGLARILMIRAIKKFQKYDKKSWEELLWYLKNRYEWTRFSHSSKEVISILKVFIESEKGKNEKILKKFQLNVSNYPLEEVLERKPTDPNTRQKMYDCKGE